MKEIMILSLSRLGDHIQSTPLLRNLRSRYPGARITMVAERRFADILPLMGGFDRTILYDNRETAWRVGMEDDPLAAYTCLESFVRQLEDTRYDLVVNITMSRLSDFLVSLVPTAGASGTIAGARGARRVVSDWAAYLLSTLNGDNRRFNRINLVDVFTGIGGGKPDGRPVELFETARGRAFADQFLAAHGLDGRRLVGLQLGASKAIRCWDTDRFAALCDRLRERWGCKVVLFGGPGEKHLAEQVIAMAAHAPVDAVGKTSIEELFSLVKRLTLLVTNDTGTMHFAAAGGVPSVILCLGPAFFRGTGPYSSGTIALHPDLPWSPSPYRPHCAAPLGRPRVTSAAGEGA
ncbi:glycosyltransferase family 9 protein, partial [bacterium]|nr:glycosyltransferase family 9 protein [bacterium]